MVLKTKKFITLYLKSWDKIRIAKIQILQNVIKHLNFQS